MVRKWLGSAWTVGGQWFSSTMIRQWSGNGLVRQWWDNCQTMVWLDNDQTMDSQWVGYTMVRK